jgi:predicted ester cyclase
MPLTRQQMDMMIDQHFAFEASDDVEGVLSTLASDATHDVVGWPAGPTHGREAARDFYVRMFADLAESSVRSVRRLYGDGFIVDESVWEGRAPGAPFGFEGKDRPLTFRILHVVEFNESGRIQRENVWCDTGAIAAQLSPENTNAR